MPSDFDESHQPLHYATSDTFSASQPFFKSVLAVSALAGVFVNCFLICVAIEMLCRAPWVYIDLQRDSRAYGREVAPATIASLEKPWSLWFATSAVFITATLGLSLAVHLLRSVWTLNRRASPGVDPLRHYRRWKLLGSVATAVALFWYGTEQHSFWTAATRHSGVGSGPPIWETTILLAGGLLPWWWIGNDNGSTRAE